MTMRFLILASSLLCMAELSSVAHAQGTTPSGVAGSQTPPPASEELGDEPAGPQLPWMAGLSWSQGYTVAGLSQSSALTFNPTYAWAFLLTAGYNFDKATALTVNQYAVIELTDSDTTNTPQELVLYDTTADVSHRLRYEIDPHQDLALVGALGLALPTSKTSQAASVILTARARIGATYTWKRVLHGLDVGPSFGYWRRFNNSNTLASETKFPCDRAGSGSQDCFGLGSPSTSRDVFLLGIDNSLLLTDKWVAGLSFTFFWVLARPLSTAEEMTLTGPVTVADTSVTHARNTRWLLVSLGYKITDWLSVTARVTNIFSERGPDGRLRAPFNPIDTVVGLELGISFDQLFLSSQAHGASKR